MKRIDGITKPTNARVLVNGDDLKLSTVKTILDMHGQFETEGIPYLVKMGQLDVVKRLRKLTENNSHFADYILRSDIYAYLDRIEEDIDND